MGTKQIPYAGYFSASWYNREESYLEQLEVFSESYFLIAQNMILHLRVITYISFVRQSDIRWCGMSANQLMISLLLDIYIVYLIILSFYQFLF